jgi:tRNA threonylcarbamoyladenosine biosynthesis protein TsaB
MIVFGFDTATPSTAVGLRLADGRTIEARDDPRPGEHPGHATRLLPMARAVLAEAGIDWTAVERVAVGVGPGTFTGLRVGVATARGLAQSLPSELVGVSSLHALAAAAFSDPARKGDGRGEPPELVLAVIDARRGEVFAAAYERGEQGSRELLAPLALTPGELPRLLDEARERCARDGSWLAVGDGAVRYRAHLAGEQGTVPADRSPLHLVGAAAICELGGDGAAAAQLEQVVPDYRRRPDAELALEAATTGAASGG